MQLGNTETIICCVLSFFLLIYILHVISRDLPEWKMPDLFTPLTHPITLNLSEDNRPLSSDSADKDVKTTYVIEDADMEYYRNNKKSIVEEYEARQATYAPREKSERPDRRQQPQEAAATTDAIVLRHLFDEIRVDGNSQNVHDISVQSTTKALFQEKESIFDSLKGDCRADILEYAQTASDLPAKKLNDIYFVLGEIYDRNAPIYSLQKKETEVLSQVWWNGNDKVKRQVLNELVDCKKQDPWDDAPTIYCPTGVVTRIVAASSIENPEKMPKTKEILRSEMLTTAAQVREELAANPTYGKLSDEDQNAMFRATLEKTYDKAYDGVISKDVVHAEMNEWIDAV